MSLLALIVPNVVRARATDPPEPYMLARAEDQERARLRDVPCAEADIGHGCFRYDGQLLREAPCSYHVDAISIGFLPTDQCYKMDPPRHFSGIWIDAFEGQAFIPDGTTPPEWPHSRTTSPEWREQFDRAQAAAIWLNIERVRPRGSARWNGRKMQIEFVGRKTTFPGSYGHMGMAGNEIVVDRIISLTPVR